MKNIKNVAKIVTIGAMVFTTLFVSPVANAAPTNQPDCIDAGGTWVESAQRCNGAQSNSGGSGDGDWNGNNSENTCGGVSTAIINCKETGESGEIEDTGVWRLLIMAIQILTAGVAVAALGGLVYGAVLYTSSGGNPEQVKKARTVFTNVVIGIIAYAGMYVLLQFLIPGGVFS